MYCGRINMIIHVHMQINMFNYVKLLSINMFNEYGHLSTYIIK